ncbi:DUF1858 domain-containing protein [Siculibacillus lacustris]|uniref:DUF1858 domain-containing protein n=1 Tax=Siculibacillus lacustris TaxID=1549641 RepID=A0A4Q9VG46_9HYPH|nr:DUF1858 domain-containing protein [Siculibacillus lacustris]TBW33775.1 DUF1858 domain-containing protein [Siculibacillus lacustris]
MDIDPESVVDDVMRRWPATIAVFLANRMHCIGCPVGRMHTIAEACAEHALDRATVLAQLAAAAGRAHEAPR